MFKIKYKFLIFILLSFIVLILANGCGTKAECEVNSDCSRKVCSDVACIDEQCEYTAIRNCCGNNIKEPIEDGKAGNSCTCPEDYGECSGKGQIKYGSRTIDTTYLERFCKNNRCIFGVPEEKIRQVSLVDENDFGFFKLETTATFNEPFDVNKDSFEFRVTLKDDDEDLIFPIKLNKILLMDGEVLYGEKDINLVLNKVGESTTVDVPLFYEPSQLEEIVRITYEFDYEYSKRVKDQRQEDGSYSYKEELVRNDFQNRFTTKITFVKSGIE